MAADPNKIVITALRTASAALQLAPQDGPQAWIGRLAAEVAGGAASILVAGTDANGWRWDATMSAAVSSAVQDAARCIPYIDGRAAELIADAVTDAFGAGSRIARNVKRGSA